MSEIRPFAIDFPQSALDDLKERLRRTRWTDEPAGAGWSMGTNAGYMKSLANYWLDEYDWRKHEAELNQFHHFTTEIDGTTIHFIHERGKGANPKPLLLLHGWPDSFYRYHKVIPMLTDPARFGGDPNVSFDVIVPSLPGTGFSGHKALSSDESADIFATLMTGVLGYQRFIAAGGDSGAIITKSLVLYHPDALLAIHLTDVGYPDGNTDFASLTPPEQEYAGFIQNWWFQEGAFNMIQATKPQSLAFGLNDSPVGLAAWIMSFFTMGTTGEAIEQRFSRDDLLTNITLYWLTETYPSSARIYYADSHAQLRAKAGQRSSVPAGVAHCPWDSPLPREWAARQVNLQHFSDLARGGHFAAWEVPELYAADIVDFIRLLNP